MNARIAHYLSANSRKISSSGNWEKLRFVCIDSESTGFDPLKDRLVSLAGLGLMDGAIDLADQFSVIMPVSHNTSAVTVHGITREAAASGVEEPEALRSFLAWLGNGILVGHHVRHDLVLLNQACLRHFSLVLCNIALDTLEAYRLLRQAGGFPGHQGLSTETLDDLCQRFQIVPHDRHTALGDAFLTAHLLLRILKESARFQMWNLQDLGAFRADVSGPEAGA